MLDYDEVANINWVRLRLKFRNDRVDIKALGRDGTTLATFRGTRASSDPAH